MTGSSRLPNPEMTAGMMKKKVMSIACTGHGQTAGLSVTVTLVVAASAY